MVAITKRVGLGRNLTAAEVDTNLQNLSDGIDAVSGAVTTATTAASAAASAATTAASSATAAATAAAGKASQSALDSLATTVAGLSAGSSVPIATTYATAIPFDAYRDMGQHTVTGAITFTKNLTGSAVGAGTDLVLIADGSHTPDFSAFRLLGSVSYNTTAGAINLISFFRTAAGYYYSVGDGGVLDVTAPLEVSVTVENAAASVANYLFDEDLDQSQQPPPATCFTFDAGHTALAATWGTGLRTVAVTVTPAFVYGEASHTANYTANGTRNLRDASLNEVANFSAKPVTNNVAAVDTTAPTLVSATVQNSTPSQVDLVWSEAMNATWSASTAFGVSGHTVSSITRLTATTGYLTLTAPVANGETPAFSYTQPGSNKMQDLAGNLLAAITSASITNNVAGATALHMTVFSSQAGATGTTPDGISTGQPAQKAAGANLHFPLAVASSVIFTVPVRDVPNGNAMAQFDGTDNTSLVDINSQNILAVGFGGGDTTYSAWANNSSVYQGSGYAIGSTDQLQLSKSAVSGGNVTLSAMVSTDNGATWNTIKTVTMADQVFYLKFSISAAGGTPGTTTVTFVSNAGMA